MDDCTFCRISRAVPDTARNRHFRWQLDIHPVSPGHMLVVPHRHVTKLAELTYDEWIGLRASLTGAIAYIEKSSPEMSATYRAMRDKRLTENSVLFIEEILDHPGLGTKPHGYNHGVNQGLAAGQTVEHLHWHVIPRYQGDVPDPRGGVRHVIPQRANYHVR